MLVPDIPHGRTGSGQVSLFAEPRGRVTPEAGLKIAPACDNRGDGRLFSSAGGGPKDHEELLRNPPGHGLDPGYGASAVPKATVSGVRSAFRAWLEPSEAA